MEYPTTQSPDAPIDTANASAQPAEPSAPITPPAPDLATLFNKPGLKSLEDAAQSYKEAERKITEQAAETARYKQAVMDLLERASAPPAAPPAPPPAEPSDEDLAQMLASRPKEVLSRVARAAKEQATNEMRAEIGLKDTVRDFLHAHPELHDQDTARVFAAFLDTQTGGRPVADRLAEAHTKTTEFLTKVKNEGKKLKEQEITSQSAAGLIGPEGGGGGRGKPSEDHVETYEEYIASRRAAATRGMDLLR